MATTDEWPTGRKRQRPPGSLACWTARYEALGYDGAMAAAMAAEDDARDALLAARGHGCQPETGYCYCWIEVWEDICRLPQGHEGPHEFTPDDEIVLDFR